MSPAFIGMTAGTVATLVIFVVLQRFRIRMGFGAVGMGLIILDAGRSIGRSFDGLDSVLDALWLVVWLIVLVVGVARAQRA